MRRRSRGNSTVKSPSDYIREIDKATDMFREVDEGLGIVDDGWTVLPNKQEGSELTALEKYRSRKEKEGKITSVGRGIVVSDKQDNKSISKLTTVPKQVEPELTALEKYRARKEKEHMTSSVSMGRGKIDQLKTTRKSRELDALKRLEKELDAEWKRIMPVSPDHNQTRNMEIVPRLTTESSKYETRAVSPEINQYHYSDEQELVYIAGSMRGGCYHSTSGCNGLRNSRRGVNGITTITKEGAGMRNMRPCLLCKPTSTLTSPATGTHLIKYEGQSTSQLVPKVSSEFTRYSSSGTNQSTVYVAASLKGHCYHSHSECKGLRDANGVTSILLKNAHVMSMRPCKVCRPTEGSLKDGYSLCASSGNHLIRNTNEVSLSAREEMTCWVTPSGQCYHSSRSCSSLRRSKIVKQEFSIPNGKRACSKCC